MKQKIFYILLLVAVVIAATNQSYAQNATTNSVKVDTTGTLIYPFKDEGAFDYPDEVPEEPLYLSRPGNIEWKYEYNPDTRQYIIYEKVGDMYYRLPKAMSMQEFVKYDFDRSIQNYWRTRKETEEIEVQRGGLIPQLKIESEAFNNIFGSEVIDIKPQGYVEVQFGLESNYIDDKTLPERLQRVTTFDFQNQINLSVNGKIGDKVNMNFNYNTEASFDFENKMKLEYNGKEDEIIRKIEAGNVSLPLNGTLIQGGTNLFGIKTEMQFGRLNVTTVISQHKGESQVIQTEGGAQKTNFEIKALDYDENRHFFISKYFRDHYNESLKTYPVRSKITVNKIEVWITNKSQNYNSARDIVAFVDLGEIDGNIYNTITEFGPTSGEKYPSNNANGMYKELDNSYSGIRTSSSITKVLDPLKSRNFVAGVDWEKIDQARKLAPSEYTFNDRLGFISLNSPLNNDEVLAVAYDYTVNGQDGSIQVGEFSTGTYPEANQTLILKLLKGVDLSPDRPTWDLMMKNVYSLGAYELSSEDFDLQVMYKNDSTNTYINYMPEGELRDTTLLRLMNLDNLNSQLDAVPSGDGMFDFIEGQTIIKTNGRIIFPVLEPFGKNISDNLSNPILKEKYAYETLYTKSKTEAEQDNEHNKFALIGSYKGSSGSEIALNAFNLAPGSVKVSAGGLELKEDIDYVVDYAMGRVKIINTGLIEAGTPIQVSTESQELISTQRKTLIGSYASYAFSDKLNVGGTMLWMNERPITNKVELGEEPVTNMMLGLDFQYRERSKFLTDVVNLLPFYESDVESSFSMEGEVAKLFPGKSKTTGNQVYVDDFEGVETPYSFLNPYNWSMSSTPQMFPEADSTDNLIYGFNRAKLAWYFIDRNVFNVPSSDMPAHLKSDLDAQSNHYTREILSAEIYPGKELPIGTPGYLSVLNLAYYPREKGPYNFDSKPTNISAGVDRNDNLLNPDSRWAGIMHEIYTPNFEAANVEYIEFWVLDPFIYNKESQGGDLYFDLGNISEDVLKDGRKAFENGLPSTGLVEDVDTTVWGRVSTKRQLGSGFENVADSRKYQDVGLDGLGDTEEASFFSGYLNRMEQLLSPEAFDKVAVDPANDDFHYYRSSKFDDEEKSVLERYKNFNNPEGNTPTQDMITEPYPVGGKTGPDMEDINEDNTLSETESYYQYKVSIRPEDMEVGKNFIVDKVAYTAKLKNGNSETVNWYQFKIPIQDEKSMESKVGSISGFKSIRFMRMFLTDFEDSVILRFGTLNLVRADWRKEKASLVEKGSIESSNSNFELSSINIEENGNRKPINYILPPDIEREIDPSNPTPIQMNEQSMLLKVENLEQGDAKAVYKNIGVDMRQYKRLRMEVHAEALEDEPLADYELSLFVRLGSDIDNYYEYEIPLKLTPVPATSYQNDVETDRYIVWPDENRLDIALEKFSNLKLDRDAEARKAGSTVRLTDEYPAFDTDSPGSKNIIKIKGNPTLGDVQIMHVGVRNPKRNNLSARSVEVWINELRMSDFDVKGGWASNGRMSLRLADLGNISVAGRTQSVGWGSINEAASQRSLDNKYEFDIAATTELGKLLPEKVGLHMPLFYSVSKSVASPEYDPLNTDIKMKDALAAIESPEERDTLLAISQDVLTRKSFNLNNISIEPKRKKADRKPLPTDIENFSLSYSKNEQLSHNIDVAEDLRRSEKGVFNYNYSMRSQPIAPLKNVKFLKAKPLQIISDFNFSVLPEMISFRTDLSRNYSQRQARNNSGLNIELPTTVQKDFLWNRYFDFRYNLSSSLSIDFTNKNVSRIDELEGVMDKNLYPDEYQLMMEEIMKNLTSFGRPIDYQHSVKISYRVPINKLPLLDWTTARVDYDGDYNWAAGPQLSTPAGEDPIEVGNTAANGNRISLNGQLNFTTLYNKVPYFKKINSKYQTTTRTYGSRARTNQRTQDQSDKKEEPKRTKDVKYNEKNVAFRADVPKSIFHRLGTNKVKVLVLNEKGDTIQGEVTVVDVNRINFKPAVSIRAAKVYITGTKELDETVAEKAVGYTVRALLGVRNARINYSRTGGTELPGFLPEPYLFGARNDASTANILAPTLPFLLGWQDENFVTQAATNGWITTDNSLTKQYGYSSSKSWTFGATVEPIPNFTIELSGSWKDASNFTSDVFYNDEDLAFEFQNGKESGNFDMSIYTLKTAFRDNLSDTLKQSVVFNDFRNTNRQIIADRLNTQRGWDGTAYSKHDGDTIQGINLNSSDVIIPAFIAAYTGIDANKIPLTARPGLQWVRPNWRVNYRGNPRNIEWMKDYITTLNFTHSYKSNYTIGKFETNLAYKTDANGLSWAREGTGGRSFVSELDIASINIQESFSPLINVDVGFVNDLSTRFEINKSRNMNFDFANTQLNETIKNEFTFGIGYRFTGMDMIIKSRAKTEKVSNDVNLRLDVTRSDYKTTLRKIDERDGEVNGGAKVMSMDFQADYMISDKLTVKLYYQYNMNTPHTTNNGNPRSNTKFGLSFNFSIL